MNPQPDESQLTTRLARLEAELAAVGKTAQLRRRFAFGAIGVLAFAATIGSALAANGNCPNGLPFCFSANQPAIAAEVNQNFAQLKEWLEANLNGAIVRRDYAGGQMSRDMNLFVDHDGTAYHITASEENGTLHISQLSADYLSFTDRWVRVFPGKHNEAPAVFKRNGKYYMITSGCTGWNPNAARSAVASSMLGEWRSLGNPSRGTRAEEDTTFESQSTYVLPVPDKREAFIFMADRWRPANPIDGRYIWLPLHWESDKPVLRWMKVWSLSDFN